jgi:hypothetical protein
VGQVKVGVERAEAGSRDDDIRVECEREVSVGLG